MRHPPSHRGHGQSAAGTGARSGRGTRLERLSELLERASDHVLAVLHALCVTLPKQLGTKRVQNRIGLALSLIGAVLTAFAVVSTFVPGNLNAVLLLFLIGPFLTLGEQLRRGKMRGNPDPAPTSLASFSAVGASLLSEFRPLSLRWHGLWSGAGLVYCFIMLGVPELYSVEGVALLPAEYVQDVAMQWSVTGTFGFGFLTASFASFYKKAHFSKMTRRQGILLGHDAPHSAVWRFATYTHRLDIWTAYMGGGVLSLAFTLPVVASDMRRANPPGAPAEPEVQMVFNLGFASLAIGGGIYLLALWMCSKHWKAAMPLGMAQS